VNDPPARQFSNDDLPPRSSTGEYILSRRSVDGGKRGSFGSSVVELIGEAVVGEDLEVRTHG
jgi:hypothetical protein